MTDRKRLGNYQLVKLLGRGGMAEVWEAFAANDRVTKVAVKTLPLDDAHTASSLRHLLDEARLGIRLDHPNLVRTLDVVEEGRRVGIVMELLDGHTAAEVCRPDQVPPLGWTVTVALDVLAGLQHLHTLASPEGVPLGLVHRDLKPSNLLITRGGVAKIIDFGIAHLEGTDRTQTRTGLLRGSVPYCSPEMARHEPLDARSDLFSFGVVLHELLTGRRCFAQKSEAAILSAVLWSPAQPVRQSNPSVPEALEALVAELLEKEPGKRPTSAQHTRERLEAAVPAAQRFDRAQVTAWLQSATARRSVGGHTASASVQVDLEEAAKEVPAPKPSRRGLILGLSAGALAVALLAMFLLPFRRPAEPVERKAAPPAIAVPTPPPMSAPVAPAPEPKPKPIAPVARPSPPPKGRGWLTVGVASGWANIQVDGKDLGPTPIFRLEIAAGRHVVTATRKDGVQTVQTLIIEPRKEKKLSIQWNEK